MNQELGTIKLLAIEPDEYYHAQLRNHFADIAELRIVKRGEEALEILQSESPDIVITELLLSDGHAYDLLPKIRQVPVIIYTVIAHLEDVQAAMSLGITGYFIKGQDTINDVKRLVLALDS